MFSALECCGGRNFVVVPFFGLLEAQFTAAFALFISIVIGLLYILRKHWIKILSLLIIICSIAFQIVAASTGHENGVKGWMKALDMAKVDIESVALKQWIQEHTMAKRKKNIQNNIHNNKFEFEFSKYREPKRIRVLSLNESLEASELLFSDKDSWIHMDRRAGPLPSFIYGTYYQYNSHNIPFPTPKQVKDGYYKYQKEVKEKNGGVLDEMIGIKATSTINYCDKYGVQYYNDKQIKLFKKLNIHEKFKNAISEYIQMPVKFHPYWGLPGIHITYSHKVMEYNIFQSHVDGTYSPITAEFQGRGPLKECVPFHRLSITLTLQVPSSGAGLLMHIYNDKKEGCNDSMIQKANDYLDRNGEYRTNEQSKVNENGKDGGNGGNEQFKREMDESLEDVLSCLDVSYEEYVPGEAVIHSGSVIHSVAPWKYNHRNSYKDARVTLQGFAFLCDGAWYLHW